MGVDGITKEAYRQNLEGNLSALRTRMRAGQYRHQPIRRVRIAKAPNKTRPIGISSVEDKIVQGALREVLEAIYEQDFESCSYGFRPGRSAHDALRGIAGSFDFAVAAIRRVRRGGIVASANTQINRLWFPDLDALLDLWIELGITGWQMQLTVPMGRAADHPDWLIQPYELAVVYPKLADLARRGAERGVRFWLANNIGYFGPFEALLRGRGMEGNAVWGGCVAGKRAMGLESNGAVRLPFAADGLDASVDG